MSTKRRIMKEFHLAEISLVDSPAQAPARVAILKRDVEKRKMVTSMTAGHAHTLLSDNPYGGENRMGRTSYDEGHDHGWVMDEAGGVFIADAMGHSHGIAVLTKHGSMPDGALPILTAEDLTKAVLAFEHIRNKEAAAEHVCRRAHALGLSDRIPQALAHLGKNWQNTPSPEGAPVAEGTNQPTGATKAATSGAQKESKMTPEQLAALQKAAEDSKAKVAELEKANARSQSILKLQREQREHFDTLKTAEQDEFLALSDVQREQVIKNLRDGNPVVFKSADGTEYRKSDDPRLVKMARDRDADQAALAREQAIRKQADLEKRSGELFKNLSGDAATKSALLGAIESIADEATRGKVLEIVKANDAGLAAAMTRLGTSLGTNVDKKAADKLDDLAKKYAADNKCDLAKAYSEVLKTAEGIELYQQNRAGK